MVEKIPDNQANNSPLPRENESLNLLVFTIHDIRFGVPAELLDHVVRMVAITPVPTISPGISGIINYHGEILPVFSLRAFFSLPDKIPENQDYLLIIRTERNVAIIAEQILGIITPSEEIIRTDMISDSIHGISGIVRCDDGLLVIANPKDLISLEDQEKIQIMKEFFEI